MSENQKVGLRIALWLIFIFGPMAVLVWEVVLTVAAFLGYIALMTWLAEKLCVYIENKFE